MTLHFLVRYPPESENRSKVVKGKPSITAITAARFRAAHLLIDGQPKIFSDEFALRFSGADSEASFLNSLNAMMAEVSAKVGPEIAQMVFRAPRAAMVMRSRYAEDALSEAITRGIRRYVILGAGLDSFAWRRRDLEPTMQVFEIDHAATQEWKQQRLREIGIDPPGNLVFLPIDFERQTLIGGLRLGGYPLQEPAFISWLGVTQYLPKESVLSTLRQVRTLAPGTELTFTFLVPQDLWIGEERGLFPIAAASTAASGEPWISFFQPAEIAAQMRELGFTQVLHFSPEDANRRYFAGRSDGLRVTSAEHLMRARVG